MNHFVSSFLAIVHQEHLHDIRANGIPYGNHVLGVCVVLVLRPEFGSFYPRAHWAIEALLGSAEFDALKWTLQPGAFLDAYLAPVAQYIKHYKQTGEQGTLNLIMAEDTPVAPNDPNEVGAFAALGSD